MAYSPFAQAPKSTILQRSLQNGLKALLGENSARLPHFGQATKRFLLVSMVCSVLINGIQAKDHQVLDFGLD
jgi:hypothetical protein